MAKPLVIPYTREFKLGDEGPDCLAVKRALRHAGTYPKGKGGMPSAVFGPAAVRALKKFQTRNANVRVGIGKYTRPTHAALRAGKHFDAYGAYLMRRAARGGKEAQTRARIVSAALYAHNHSPRHYSQDMALRMEGLRREIKPPNMWSYADCSGFATWAYWLAGAPDPNGSRYTGYPATPMYTGSMAQHGKKVSRNEANPGDLAIYGSSWPYGHVAVYIGGGKVVSHGHEGGPFLEDWDYRGDLNHLRSYF